MTKHILTGVLALWLSLSFTACSDKDSKETTTTPMSATADGSETRTDHTDLSGLKFDVPAGVMTVKGLKTPAAFAQISPESERSAAYFTELSKVILHPRCSNCHPRDGGGPTQGDDMHPHSPPMIRGQDMGPDAMMCNSCHGTDNVTFSSMEGSVPGADPWLLAPETMGWAGMTDIGALCEQIKNKDRNGGRSLAEIAHHNGVDHLVGWAWNPGEGRSPAPGTQDVFGALTKAWAETGGHCPD